MHSIYHDLFIEATVDALFDRIVLPEHLINWWPLTCTGENRLHGLYNFYFEEAYDWWGKVITFQQGKSFHVKMIDADEDWNPTTFGFDLRPEGEGVWLEFWHKGWPSVNHHFRRSSHCWAMLLLGLKEYVEDGKIIPFENRS